MNSKFQFLKIFQKIYDQLFEKKDNDVVTFDEVITVPTSFQ